MSKIRLGIQTFGLAYTIDSQRFRIACYQKAILKANLNGLAKLIQVDISLQNVEGCGRPLEDALYKNGGGRKEGDWMFRYINERSFRSSSRIRQLCCSCFRLVSLQKVGIFVK